MERRTALRSLAAGIALAIAGCGDGGNGNNDTDGDESPTDEETPTEGETPGDETPGDGEPGGGVGEAAQTVQVGAGEGFSFDPDEFSISPGDTVVWEWVQGEHNIVPDSIPADSDWDGTEGGPDQTYTDHTYEYTFDTPGEYEYYCAVHRDLGMTGSFTVEEEGAGAGGEETPGDGNETSPGDGNETSPGDGNETSPGDGNETSPGNDTNVTQ
jgi:plastocyanin